MSAADPMQARLAAAFSAEGSMQPEHLARIAVEELGLMCAPALSQLDAQQAALLDLVNAAANAKAAIADRVYDVNTGKIYKNLNEAIRQATRVLGMAEPKRRPHA